MTEGCDTLGVKTGLRKNVSKMFLGFLEVSVVRMCRVNHTFAIGLVMGSGAALGSIRHSIEAQFSWSVCGSWTDFRSSATLAH